MVSRNTDKAFVICGMSLRTISKMASDDGWADTARNGVITFYSCLLNLGVDHDHLTNNIFGGNESYHLSSLSQMFEVLANNVKSVELANDCEYSWNCSFKPVGAHIDIQALGGGREKNTDNWSR